MCTDGCKNCIGKFCIAGQCKQGYYYNNNILNVQCLNCDQSCLECNGAGNSKCTSCRDNFQFLNGQCISCKINNGEFYDSSDKKCHPCSLNCLTCSDQNTCTQCVNNFVLIDKICSQTCPQKNQFYDKNNICLNCDSSCQTCIYAATICTSCPINFYLNTKSQKCQIKCDQPGFFIQQNNCMPCDSSCLTCKETPTNCTSCQPYQFLNVLQYTCSPKCPENGFYISGQRCMPCHPSCATCSGPLQTQCNSCQSNLFKYGDDKICKTCPNSSIDHSITVQKMQNCYQVSQKCLLNFQTYKYELIVICSQCQNPYVLSNNNCVKTCSEVAQDYSFNNQLGYCQCIPSSPFQHNLQNDNILCSSFQLSGYYCDQNKICNPCQQSKCQICVNLQVCTTCEQGYYLWQNNCINACESDLGLEVSQSNNQCVCKRSYIFQAQKQICILQLQISSIKLTKDSQYNIITVVFNRSPYPDELKTMSLQIDPNKLIPIIDYTIVTQYQNEKNLVFYISTHQNIKISQIVIYYINIQVIYKVQNTVLTSEETNYNLQSRQSLTSYMNSLGQTLSPQEGAAQTIVNILKNFQIICLLFNFVQLLGPLIVFKDYLPQPLYVGALLGASFIFTEIPNSDELSANLIGSNNNNQEQSSQQSLLEHLGFNENIYSNLPVPHLLLIACVVISLLCLCARWTMKEYSSQRLVAVIQLLMHIIFLILICGIVIKKDIEYIKNNIPNLILNLNIKSRGWKSYIIMNYLKKYICITIIYAFYHYPLECCIQMMQKDIISNEEMISTIDFSLIVLYMIISCLAIGLLIFIAKTMHTQNKQNLELPVIKIQLGSSYINKICKSSNSVKNNLKNENLKQEII
ncbi:transmembrane protein, putative (macronuclear) [Tetrahymena thermophila SB210]|uniref:Transmembrane protein, putative n=1 Tax=Tetrahymena thermophila (strain SB210) TaxID=312017 RepID=W7XF36_TETTS|nr:transmembrane protein, putative [Tetrahymena thermophila SB210]EWS75403.1 transmembrane protein, putative [Tetrahymena thermophila SB210]|eukprot:XP_012652077.1 transmembrane protein, putative [Tetrahymena thermophila SB210]